MIPTSTLSNASLDKFCIGTLSLPLELQGRIFSMLPLSFLREVILVPPNEVIQIDTVLRKVLSTMGSLAQTLIFQSDHHPYSISRLNLYLKKEVREIIGDKDDSIDSRSIETLAFTCLKIDAFIHTSLQELSEEKLVALILFTLNHQDLTVLECSIKQNIIFSPSHLEEILKEAVRSNNQNAVQMIVSWNQIEQMEPMNFFEIFKLCFAHDNRILTEILITTPLFNSLSELQISSLFLEACEIGQKEFISLFKISCRANDLPAEILRDGFKFACLIKDPWILQEILTYPTNSDLQNLHISKGLLNAVTHEYIKNIEIIIFSIHAKKISPVHFGTIFANSCKKRDLSIASMLMQVPNYQKIQKRELMKALNSCCEKNALFLVHEILSHPNFGKFDESIADDLYKQACVNGFDLLKNLLFPYVSQTFKLCEKIKELNCTIS